MKIVVVGAGAREHALATVLAKWHEVIVTPGNDLIARDVPVTPLGPLHWNPDLAVIGPEAPLVDGLADELRARGIPVLGPGKDGALLEGSKAFLKEVLADAGVATAGFGTATGLDRAIELLDSFGPPYVVKTDGLAAGKGVLVTTDRQAAIEDVKAKLSGAAFGEAGTRVVIEQGLFGQEVSVFALTNGRDFVLLPSARDHKRLFDGDLGPNTGGMGAVSPVPGLGEADLGVVADTIIEPTIAELRRRGIDYRGVLYAGLMMTPDGPRVIEYNVRLGDPEAEAVLPLVESDLGEAFLAAALGEPLPPIAIRDAAAATVVMAARGYPAAPAAGDPIAGIESLSYLEDLYVFGAGVRREGSSMVTAGGRVLAVTAVAPTLEIARDNAYRAVSRIGFDGAQVRSDIGSS